MCKALCTAFLLISKLSNFGGDINFRVVVVVQEDGKVEGSSGIGGEGSVSSKTCWIWLES